MGVQYSSNYFQSGEMADQPTVNRAWTTGMCDYCHDCETCCCGSFCPCFQACGTANALQSSGFLYCLLTFICGPCLPICLLRNKARSRYGIPGSVMGDCCSAFCCSCCTSIQETSPLRVFSIAVINTV